MAIDVTRVLVGAPDQLATGAILDAPVGSKLPTDAVSAVDKAFSDSGYVSEDGLSLKTDKSTTSIKDWSLTSVRKLLDEFEAVISWSEIQMSYESLCHAFGTENVKKTPANNQHGEQISVSVNASLPDPRAWVFNMKDGKNRTRIVVPNGQVTSLDEIAFQAAEVMALPLELSCYPDAAGNVIYIYFDNGEVLTA